MTTEKDLLEWAAQWIEDSLKGEANERVIEFGKNMAMTIRAAALSVARVSGDVGTGEAEAFTKHLMQRHEELAAHMRDVCGRAVDLIEQYTRFDFFMWLTHDPSGLQSDPIKRAAEAKQLLEGLIASKPSTRPAVAGPTEEVETLDDDTAAAFDEFLRTDPSAQEAMRLQWAVRMEKDAGPTSATPDTEELYGVGGALYTFIDTMLPDLQMREQWGMAQRARELKAKIAEEDLTRECRFCDSKTLTVCDYCFDKPTQRVKARDEQIKELIAERDLSVREAARDICTSHGLAVLVTHVNDGEPCSDYLSGNSVPSEIKDDALYFNPDPDPFAEAVLTGTELKAFRAKHVQPREAARDNYVAWCHYTHNHIGGIESIETCDSDAKGAFRVYAAPVVVPREDVEKSYYIAAADEQIGGFPANQQRVGERCVKCGHANEVTGGYCTHLLDDLEDKIDPERTICGCCCVFPVSRIRERRIRGLRARS